jgi:hypothetical protein
MIPVPDSPVLFTPELGLALLKAASMEELGLRIEIPTPEDAEYFRGALSKLRADNGLPMDTEIHLSADLSHILIRKKLHDVLP